MAEIFFFLVELSLLMACKNKISCGHDFKWVALGHNKIEIDIMLIEFHFWLFKTIVLHALKLRMRGLHHVNESSSFEKISCSDQSVSCNYDPSFKLGLFLELSSRLVSVSQSLSLTQESD